MSCHETATSLILLAALGTRSIRPPRAGKTMADVLAASKPADWRTLDPENTLYLELAGGRVVIELAPQFAPRHVANIRTLAREQVLRRPGDHAARRTTSSCSGAIRPMRQKKPLGAGKKTLPAEFDAAGRRPGVHRAAGSGHLRAADGLRRRLPRRARHEATALRGSCTATAWSAPAATTTRTAAAAPSSTSSPAMRRASSIATSRWSAASCRAWSCCRRCRAAPRALGFYDKPEQRVPIRADPRGRRRAGGAAHQARSAAHRHADVHGPDRGAPQPPGRVVQAQAGRIDVCNVPLPVRAVPGKKRGN